MALKLGQMNTLEVLRESDIAFVLSDGFEEIFLHKRQATRKLETQDKIEVFLYYDNQRRITATMKKPIIDADTPGFCEVIDTNSRLGVFLHTGIQKDLLLSRDDLPFKKAEWPIEGDLIFAKIKVSKNQLSAKVINRYDIQTYLVPTVELEENQEVSAIVLFFAEEGIVLSTKEGHSIFVYHKHIRKQHRLGEQVNVKIINVKQDFKYNGTMIKQKELMIGGDSEIVLKYLKLHNGIMEFTDKSSPEKILEAFQMSKSAFKRAVGKLYKEKAITIHPDSIELIETEIEPTENTIENIIE